VVIGIGAVAGQVIGGVLLHANLFGLNRVFRKFAW